MKTLDYRLLTVHYQRRAVRAIRGLALNLTCSYNKQDTLILQSEETLSMSPGYTLLIRASENLEPVVAL